ncbi:hypothetical protein GO755_02845 [Spirosoma sp. HMF4905]|uniref:Galactose oxidase n=1 Tax=Spirosoma arboris TaxID=2682092 RepID=A0A7K1S5N9_9BACT|nr:hypothetical protein [Spirosoma arboris]MVM28956.1 hypothetical protein [Spirosoma arboris]
MFQIPACVLISWLCLLGLLSCRTPALVPLIAIGESTTISPTLVSTQAVASDQAEFVVKAGFEFNPTDWKLTLLNASGRPLSLSAGAVGRLDLFNLIPYRAIGLTSGQTYRLQFATRNAGGDSVNVERLYTHRSDGPRWIRLTHAPLVGGDFAGSTLNKDNLPPSESANYLSIWRYQNDQSWQMLTYSAVDNKWYDSKDLTSVSPRHGVVRYQLQEAVGDNQTFEGLGFMISELLLGQRLYLKDMGGVTPYYAGPDGEVRFFTTLKRAYQLTEGGSPQLWVRWGNWDQYRGPDLPEPTGTLVSFRLGTTGYVVNQRPGQQIHLWAFDTEREQWSRRADFPGSLRSQGVGFTAGGKGYFGLGITANEETLRDVWQYDPTTDHWQYVTDYPGAGSTYLAVGQLPVRTLLGWGYEQQPTAAGGIRLVGCTDFWEFVP